jgi:hypothetical protein
MKLIKLNQRHNLGRRGFKYAFVFKTYSQGQISEYAVGEMVRKAEGMGWMYDHTFYGKSPGNDGRRPYYIGFNNESTATLVQLQI